MSLDGKIATSGRELFYLGSERDRELLRKLRNDAGAVLFGAGVLRTFRRACLPGNKERIINAVVTRRFEKMNPKWKFFTDPRIDRFFYVTERISEATRKKFSTYGEIIHVPAKNLVQTILRDLSLRGVRCVALEGGGEMLWPFVKADKVDDYYVTLTPLVIGGKTAPTLVDGVGFDPLSVLKLRLVRVRRIGNELFLHYRPAKTSERSKGAGTQGRARRSRVYRKTKA